VKKKKMKKVATVREVRARQKKLVLTKHDEFGEEYKDILIIQ
jgi:hypothetical protein